MRTPSQEAQSTFELHELSNMDRIKSIFHSRPDYEPLQTDAERDDESAHDDSVDTASNPPFSWVEYTIFLMLGIAMLWAW